MGRLAFRIIASRQLKQVSLVYPYHSHSGNPRMEGLRDQLPAPTQVPLRKTSQEWRGEYTSHTQGPKLFIPCALYYSDTNSQAYIYPFINNLLVIKKKNYKLNSQGHGHSLKIMVKGTVAKLTSYFAVYSSCIGKGFLTSLKGRGGAATGYKRRKLNH